MLTDLLFQLLLCFSSVFTLKKKYPQKNSKVYLILYLLHYFIYFIFHIQYLQLVLHNWFSWFTFPISCFSPLKWFITRFKNSCSICSIYLASSFKDFSVCLLFFHNICFSPTLLFFLYPSCTRIISKWFNNQIV